MSPQQDWHEIVDGLRGRRLAVYDDLLNGKPVNVDAPEIQNALGWLGFNRFVYRDGDRLVTRPVLRARDLYITDGPARDSAGLCNQLPERDGPAAPINWVEGRSDKAAPCPAPATAPATVTEKPKPRAVHTHQTSLFDS